MAKDFLQIPLQAGFVTRQNLSDLPPEIGAEVDVAIYLPMSYMIGGYLVLVPSTAIQPIDMSVEDALRFTLTAGITGARSGQHPPASPNTAKREI